MNKPVIILGGGIWGCLLAYKLKESLPDIEFSLYEESSVLGRHEVWTFRESDCFESINWLRPLISKSWYEHRINLNDSQKTYYGPCHLIDGETLHDVLLKKLPSESLCLNNPITVELALQKSSFVIDTRDICHVKKCSYKHTLTMEVELKSNHGLSAPVLFDTRISNNDSLRIFSYYPLSPNRLMIKDSFFSSYNFIPFESMRSELSKAILNLGWKVVKVLKEEVNSAVLPNSKPVCYQEGRVISLAGLSHDITGCSIPHATKLIEKMVSTSFRFGEIKEVVSNFRNEIEKDRSFLRYMNKLIIQKRSHRLMEFIYKEPQLLESFSRGKLNFVDRSRILWEHHFH